MSIYNPVGINHHYNQILTHLDTLQQLTGPVNDIDRQHQFAEAKKISRRSL